MEQLHYARLGVGQGSGSGGWQLFAEDGDMKMYRREEEVRASLINPFNTPFWQWYRRVIGFTYFQ